MPSSDSHVIKLEGISKRYFLNPAKPFKVQDLLASPRTVLGRLRAKEAFWALDDVSLEIAKGQTVGIIGHNGSGKSTLLRTMVGISPPTSGTVSVNGRYAALLELGAGFHPKATGRENAYVNALFMGLTKEEAKRLLPEIVEFSGLGKFIDQPMRTYSSGMYVRLGFSVAVHVQPEILVIDEVLAVGDADFQEKCFDHFNKVKAMGTTIVLVTHGLDVLESFADRVILMEHGRVKADGDSAAIIGEYLKERIEVSPRSRKQFMKRMAEKVAAGEIPAPEPATTIQEDSGG